MAHILLNRNHPHAGFSEHTVAVVHYALLFVSVDHRIDGFGSGRKGISSNLVISHVRTQLDEALRLRDERLKNLVPIDFNLKTLSGIHRKTVNHNLSEHTMVQIGLQGGFEPAKAESLTVESVGTASARVFDERHRNHENVGKPIKQPDVEKTKGTDECPVHPSCSVSCAVPLSIFHSSPVFTLYQF